MNCVTRAKGIMGFVLILAICNMHLLLGTDPTSLIFDTARVADGQWWRIVTHPFVHVSWYHLLLDSAALVLLWQELRLVSNQQKFLAAVCCAGGSLIFTLLTSEKVFQFGLCGFSGMAHGLAFLLGLCWLAESRLRHGRARLLLVMAGLFLSVTSLGKSLFEFFTGNVIFSQMHMGELGVPIVASHLGGVLGGLTAVIVMLLRDKRPFGLSHLLEPHPRARV